MWKRYFIQTKTKKNHNYCMWKVICFSAFKYLRQKTVACARFGSTYTKIGTIQRRLAWPLRKDDTQIREAFHILALLTMNRSLDQIPNNNFWLLPHSVSKSTQRVILKSYPSFLLLYLAPSACFHQLKSAVIKFGECIIGQCFFQATCRGAPSETDPNGRLFFSCYTRVYKPEENELATLLLFPY